MTAPHSFAFARIRVPDLQRAIDFYTYHVGLEPAVVNESEAFLRSGVRHHNLELVADPAVSTAVIEAVGYEADSAEDLTALEDQVRAAGLPVDKVHELAERYSLGGFATEDPNGLRVEFIHGHEEFADPPHRPETPLDMLHPFLMTDRFDETMAFYRDVLGFRISDLVGADAAFLRTGNRFHHSLALQRTAGPFMVGHLCFLMPNFDEVMRARARALYKEVDIPFDLAKHPGSGSQGFYLFDAEFGPRIELCHEHYRLTPEEHDTWKPRRLAADARCVDGWRAAGDDWARM